MNKKISTLFASSLLMMGTVFSTANAQVSKTVDLLKASSYYYIGLPATENAQGATYLKADVIKNTTSDNKDKEFTSLTAATQADINNAEGEDKDLYLFQVTTSKIGDLNPSTFFELTNKKTGKKVVFKGGVKADLLDATSLGLITATDNKAAVDLYVSKINCTVASDKIEVKAGTGIDFVPFHQFENGAKKANTNELSLTSSAVSVVAANAGTKLQFFGVSTENVSASKLNEALKNGFVFNATDIKAEDNIFAAQTIKAFSVATPITIEAGYTIPAGTYFATEYPAALASTSVTSITSADLFKQCTFIAVDPVTNLKADKKDEQKAGKNFGFKLMSGDNFNFYTVASTATGYDKEKISQGSQVSIYNANFTVQTNKDNEKKYAIYVENFRYKKEAAADKLEQGLAKVYVANVEKVLMTAADAAFPFTFGDAPVVKPISLLNDSTSSVYNIRFISGKDATTEKGKYLGVGVKDATSATYTFLAQGSAVATLANPQYQFIISNVNVEKNEITFRNRETAETFTCVLYTTGTENQYYVADAPQTAFTVGNLEADGTVDYASQATTLTGTTIELTVATVDKLAGFANRGENAGYTYITFALDKVSKDNLYMTVTGKTAAGVTSYDVKKASQFEAAAALFELVKSKEPVISIRNNYQYLKDGVAAEKIKGDTVAYYTYAIKWINPEIADKVYYVKADLTLETKAEAKTAAQFILKENKNGSVSIVSAASTAGLKEEATVIACSDKTYDITIDGGNPYVVADADAVKLFLTPEQLGASLEAKNQHIAFHSTTGGYLSMNAAAEGNVAIKTTADEDLTFWVDSADTKATMPSFFISKGVKDATNRMYMYFADDSSKYYIHNPHYNFNNGDVKMVFKAATLANSDTLATTVNGEAVKVATKADANGTLGGLNYFKFQIFKDNNADDVYVIRNKANNQYLKSINGLLTLGHRADAIRVYAETQNAPTSNDAIDATSFTVIAGEGQLTIVGAASKKVVISNILGQVVANTVLTSDNATVAAPAGVVVVAVEGEAAVKAIVK